MSRRSLLAPAVALALLATPAVAQHAGHMPEAAPPPVSAEMVPASSTPAPEGTVEFDHPVMDNMIFVHGILDQFEGRAGSAAPELRWSSQGWIGTDYDKLWLKTEGFRRRDGSIEDGRHELLYDRAATSFFDLQAGIRSDIDSRPTRNWAALGVQGLAPLFFNLEATGYVSDQGHFAGRFAASYDLLLTQQLILQPEIEVNLYSKADPARRVGAGFSDIDTGIRLRYEIDRKFAPYVGVSYDGKFGQTASFARRAGESTGALRVVFGIRSWL